MTGIDFGLALVATLDLCFKYGNRLVHACASFKAAESEIAERVLSIENHWTRTRLQLEFLQRVWESLDEEYQTLQKQILHALIGKLTIAVSKVDSLGVNQTSRMSMVKAQRQVAGVKRLKYVFLKEGLDRVIEDLETWQRMFDPCWFMILMISNSQIDTELKRQNETSSSALLSSTQTLRDTIRGAAREEGSIFLNADGFRSAHISDIPFSSSKVAQRAGSRKLLILNVIRRSTSSNRHFGLDIRRLAQKLVHADPTQFGLLQCKGVLREDEQFIFVFRTIEGFSRPQSLRAILLAGDTYHSLSDRLDIAKDLAKSISFVHTFGFVHKAVQPENILISSHKASSLGRSFLVGFEEFRAAEGHTEKHGDEAWEKNLYRHPRRQGPNPDDYYVMQHDIYSLGVCLLEVGLWESFVSYGEDGTGHDSPSIRTISSDLSISELGGTKNLLLLIARNILPRRMGTKYAKIVETCLMCLDEGNVDFGDEREFQDADGILVGVRYIEKVLLNLENISL